MHIGMVYDLKEDYSIDKEDITYCDFSTLTEMQHIQCVLQQQGHYVTMIGSPREFALCLQQGKLEKIEIIMNFGEGYKSRNREGIVPALCEIYKIPYTFSDSYAMSFTLHKHQTLLFAESLGINIPKGFLYQPDLNSISDLPELICQHNMTFPIVSKLNHEGTSMGLAFSDNIKELTSNIEKNCKIYKQEIRCDEYIGGHEVAVPIIGTGNEARALGIVEYQNHDGSPILHYTTHVKEKGQHKTVYQSFGEKHDCEIKNTALLIHRSIPCYDLSRIDMKYFNNIPYLLEVTPLPSLNPGSTFEFCASMNKMSPGDMYNEILASALKRYK
jgi:D-alanine-D-alanine ligase